VSKYIRSRGFTFNFDGDEVTVVLKPISFEDLMICQQVMSGEKDDRYTETSKMFAALIPKYVESVSGFFDMEGQPITKEELFNGCAYFSQLIVQIGTALIGAASPQNP
jgi:hypothetical protein